MPLAPTWFVDELKVFDKDLRLRWSRRLKMWQLERKVRRSIHPGTILNDGWHDSYIRAQDGFLLVGSIPHGCLTRTIFQKLRNSDLWKIGGWKKVADDLDYLEERYEIEKDESFSNDLRGISREAFDLIQRRSGRRINSAGYPQ